MKQFIYCRIKKVNKGRAKEQRSFEGCGQGSVPQESQLLWKKDTTRESGGVSQPMLG